MSTNLAERYGAPSPTRRRTAIVAAGLVVAVFAGWLAWATLFHADPDVESELLSYEIVDGQHASAVLVVSLVDGVTASCTLRAFAEDHSTVGELAFEPVDGRNEVTVRTERLATTVTRLGCTTEGQSRPR